MSRLLLESGGGVNGLGLAFLQCHHFDEFAKRSDDVAAIVAGIAATLILTSLVIVQPGQTSVVRFFGSYVGTVRGTGLYWILPLSDRRKCARADTLGALVLGVEFQEGASIITRRRATAWLDFVIHHTNDCS